MNNKSPFRENARIGILPGCVKAIPITLFGPARNARNDGGGKHRTEKLASILLGGHGID